MRQKKAILNVLSVPPFTSSNFPADGFNPSFMKRLFLFFALFFLVSCPSTLQTRRSGKFEKPSCSGGPSAAEIERQKEDLFRSIESSRNYTNAQARDDALQRYKKIIAGEERSSCPKDVELLIEGIAKLHET